MQSVIDRDKIVSYELNVIENSMTVLAESKNSYKEKYVVWELETKIRKIVGNQQRTVRWISNNDQSYLESYAYALLVGAMSSEANILELKNILYGIGKQCLETPQQKLLVEFLCLIEYSRERFSLLNKYPQIMLIFIRMLQFLEAISKIAKDGVDGMKLSMEFDMAHEDRYGRKNLRKVYEFFNKYFTFVSIEASTEDSHTLVLFSNQKLHIVVEKECYFVVETTKHSSELQCSIDDIIHDKWQSHPNHNNNHHNNHHPNNHHHYNTHTKPPYPNRPDELKNNPTTRKTFDNNNTIVLNSRIKHRLHIAEDIILPQDNDDNYEYSFINELNEPDDIKIPRNKQNKLGEITQLKKELEIMKNRLEDKIKGIEKRKHKDNSPENQKQKQNKKQNQNKDKNKNEDNNDSYSKQNSPSKQHSYSKQEQSTSKENSISKKIVSTDSLRLERKRKTFLSPFLKHKYTRDKFINPTIIDKPVPTHSTILLNPRSHSRESSAKAQLEEKLLGTHRHKIINGRTIVQMTEHCPMSPIYPHSTRPKHKNYLFKGDNNLKRNSDDRLKTLQTHNQSYLLPISKDSKTLFSTHTSKLQESSNNQQRVRPTIFESFESIDDISASRERLITLH